jgi:hypothetical protein
MGTHCVASSHQRALATGMVRGAIETWDRLEALLARCRLPAGTRPCSRAPQPTGSQEDRERGEGLRDRGGSGRSRRQAGRQTDPPQGLARSGTPWRSESYRFQLSTKNDAANAASPSVTRSSVPTWTANAPSRNRTTATSKRIAPGVKRTAFSSSLRNRLFSDRRKARSSAPAAAGCPREPRTGSSEPAPRPRAG